MCDMVQHPFTQQKPAPLPSPPSARRLDTSMAATIHRVNAGGFLYLFLSE